MAAQTESDYLSYLAKGKRPIPGSSLTNDPSTPLPFERAPQFTKKKDALDYLFNNMIDPEIYPQVMEGVAQGAPIMDITQTVLFEGFRQGKWNPDMFLLLIEPTAYMVMALAERADIDYRVDDEPDPEDQMEQQDSEMKQKFSQLSKKVSAGKAAESALPKDIIDKINSMPKTEQPVEEDSLLTRSRIPNADFAEEARVAEESESLIAPRK